VSGRWCGLVLYMHFGPTTLGSTSQALPARRRLESPESSEIFDMGYRILSLRSVWVGSVLWSAAIAGVGCAGAADNGNDSSVGGAMNPSGGAQTGGAVGNGGTAPAQGGSTVGTSSAPSWAKLWTNYFQGACASCHASSSVVGNGVVFANATQFCTVMTSRRQLNGTTTPPLVSSSQSVLNWFSTNGSMPQGSNTPPANAVNDIKAWAAAGAVCP
jgi:hypothetical protein